MLTKQEMSIYIRHQKEFSSIGFEIPAAIYPLEASPKSVGSILIFIGAISLMFIKNGKNQSFYFSYLLYVLL